MRLVSESASHALTWEGMCFQYITWYFATELHASPLAGAISRRGQRVLDRLVRQAGRRPGGGTRTLYQRGKALFEFPQSHVFDLQRQSEIGGDLARLLHQPWIRDLAQVQNPLVVAEEHRLQLGVAVQAQAPDHGAVEVPHEPVGQEERRRSPVGDLVETSFAGVHLVAVRSPQSRRADLLEQRLQFAGHPAIAIHHHQLFVARPELVELLAQLVHDARGIQMKESGHPVDVDVPTTPCDDVLHLAAQRPTDDECGRRHVTGSSCGNPSTDMNESLKSERPDSSTYSMRDGSSKATWRSR